MCWELGTFEGSNWIPDFLTKSIKDNGRSYLFILR
jgi:hypothetical protein